MDSLQIEQRVVLQADRELVWRAISESAQFGQWFGVAFDGPFAAGEDIVGRIAPTQIDPEVGRMQEPYAGMPWRAAVERIEPMSLFSFRWHPYAVDAARDYSAEAMTLVTFALSDAEGGTQLTITESGFEDIAQPRQAQAMQASRDGWVHQAWLIVKYLATGK